MAELGEHLPRRPGAADDRLIYLPAANAIAVADIHGAPGEKTWRRFIPNRLRSLMQVSRN